MGGHGLEFLKFNPDPNKMDQTYLNFLNPFKID